MTNPDPRALQALALPEIAALVDAAEKMAMKFEYRMRGRTWSTADMQAFEALRAALAQIRGE